MPLTGEMLNAQGNATCKKEAPTISPAFASIGESNKEVAVEVETAAAGHKFTKVAHGLVTKDLVVLTELNGKKLEKATLGETVGGLVLGGIYWVWKVGVNEFAVAVTKAQAEKEEESETVEYTAKITTSTKFTKVAELNVVARLEVKYKAAKNLLNENENAAPEIESNAAGQKAAWELYYSAVAAGTLCLVEPVLNSETGKPETKELAKGDLFKITSTKVFQNAYIQ